MTIKEIKEKLNDPEFDDDMEIEFLPRIMIDGDWNYPKPDNRKDMADIDVFKNGDKCCIENNADYFLS